MTAGTSAAILEEASRLWATTRSGYRDGMVAVGRLLHRYILARLAEATGMNEAERRAASATRRHAVLAAAERLDVPMARVNQLVAVAAAVDLLSDDGDCGRLSFAGVNAFRVLLCRGSGKPVRRSKTAPGATGRPSTIAGSVDLADREQWRLKPEMDESAAVALFRRAAAEGWHSNAILAACRKLAGRRPQAAAHGDDDRPPSCDPFSMARAAHPRDLAEMLAQMVRASRDPAAVAREFVAIARDLFRAAAG